MSRPTLATLLDLDGTLVDSEPGVRASCEAAVRSLGHPIAGGLSIRSVIGPPIEEMMGQLLAPFGDDRVAEAVLAYRDHYGREGYKGSTVYPGIVGMLDDLSALGVRLFVATSKRTIYARRVLDHLGLTARFGAVYGSEPGGSVDLKADLIAHILDHQAIAADQCQMVGDRKEDTLGALANGVASIGVLWGYGDRAELEAAGATIIVAHPADLMAVTRSRP